MVYNPPRISDIATLDDLRLAMQEEFEKISKEFNETIALDLRTVHQEPKRPREGMIASADGTDWDPGEGAGAYEYVSGAWRRISGVVDGDYGDISVAAGVWSIDADTVGNIELANMASGTVKARGTAGTGNPEDMALGNGLQIDATSLRTKQQMSITANSSGLLLDGDSASPGNTKYYGTNSSGTKGFHDVPGATLLATITATGATFGATDLAASPFYLIVFSLCSHDSGANQQLRVAISDDNGATYGTPINVLAGVVANSVLVNIFALIALTDSVSAKPVVPSSGTNAGGLESTETGVTNALQFSWSGGNGDSGTILIYGF